MDEIFDARKGAAVETLLDELFVLGRESNGHAFKLQHADGRVKTPAEGLFRDQGSWPTSIRLLPIR